MRLEDIVEGCRIKGIAGSDAVTIVATRQRGDCLEVTYKTSQGITDATLLYRDDESDLELEVHTPWTFDTDGNTLRLVLEAYRINLAHIFDPYLAVHTSSVEPLPHQISAVYQEMLPRLPLRFILADDPGAGKTIMTGLLIKELMARGALERCLIVSPGSLTDNWQEELHQKFNLHFEILTQDKIRAAASGNVFSEVNFCIARLDKLARDDELQAQLKASEWDLVVCDEAHKMSASYSGGEVNYTKRFRLGQLLSEIARNFLLLTATPHNGKQADFELFLSLIDQDRFEGASRSHEKINDVSDVMRRLVKEELLKFDGRPLFPERDASTINYHLSAQEAALYELVTSYVKTEFNRAEKLQDNRRRTVGFALTVLQRRLASSPEAIYQSLRRRLDRLNTLLEEKKHGDPNLIVCATKIDKDFDEEDLSDEEMSELEENVVGQASAADTINELNAEIEILAELVQKALSVRNSGVDKKWAELRELLQSKSFTYSENGDPEKIIIFTEHKDTLLYLENKITTLFGNPDLVTTIHGGMSRRERKKSEYLFKQDKSVRVLIATDAAGEGINLQRAHLMVNYDLPWNPNRLEQRFGRIHRIGQTEVCHLWNLVANETREGAVFQRLFEKLEQEKKALGGRVFNILGDLKFDNRSLKDLLIDAIRYDSNPTVKQRLHEVVDRTLNHEVLLKLLSERALTQDVMDIHKVNAIREEMERLEARKLQPHFIKTFFLKAFSQLNGQLRMREKGRYEILRVPYALRNMDTRSATSRCVLERYERICFDKAFCHISGSNCDAELICPGHPLMDALIAATLEKNHAVMKHGSVLVDPSNSCTDPRLLFCIEDSIVDGVVTATGKKRVISKHLHYVEMNARGEASNAGYAPYLDYRALTPEEANCISDWLSNQNWLSKDLEEVAIDYAYEKIIPLHLNEVKQHRLELVRKTREAVQDRLQREINYWDAKAAELKDKETSGKKFPANKLNSAKASQRADALQARLDKRLTTLKNEENVRANLPIISGLALIVPQSLLNTLQGSDAKGVNASYFGSGDRKSVELAGMRAVEAIEKSLGFTPHDVSSNKCGYDIESVVPENKREDGNSLRLIEVKARVKGADTVTLTQNEILTSLNARNFILALVEVDGNKTQTIYLKPSISAAPDFATTSVTFNIQKLIASSKILLQRSYN